MYTLRYPISDLENPEKQVTEVKVKDRIKGADLLVLDTVTGEQAGALAMIGQLTGLSKRQVEQLDSYDIAQLGAIIAGKSQT